MPIFRGGTGAPHPLPDGALSGQQAPSTSQPPPAFNQFAGPTQPAPPGQFNPAAQQQPLPLTNPTGQTAIQPTFGGSNDQLPPGLSGLSGGGTVGPSLTQTLPPAAGADIAGQDISVTQNLPSPQQQQLLNLALPFAQQFAGNPPRVFPGQTVAGFTPTQDLANQARLDTAVQGTNLVNDVVRAQQFGLGGVLDVQNNPVLQRATEAAIRPITQQFQNTVLPNIRSGAVSTGNIGSSRQGVAEGLASEAFLRQVGDTSAQIQNQQFQSGLDVFSRSLLTAPQTLGLLPFGAQQLDIVGQREQALNQNLINAEVARFTQGQQLPIQAATQLAGLSGTIPGGTTVSATPAQFREPSIGNRLLGGASTGAAIGDILNQPLLGAGLGALTAFFPP